MMAVAADHGPWRGRSHPVPLKHKMIADALMARSSIESWHNSHIHTEHNDDPYLTDGCVLLGWNVGFLSLYCQLNV
jgi:hypothetical protein